MSSNTNTQSEPLVLTLTNRLLGMFLPSYSKDALIGDLREEYFQRLTVNRFSANMWIIRQLLVTLATATKSAVVGESFLKGMAIVACLAVAPTLFFMVAWLSNMDQTSPKVWQLLLGANMHAIATYGNFWQQVPEAVSKIDDLHMFIHYWSVAWSGVALLVIGSVRYFKNVSAHQIALMGLIAMATPYMLGWMYINTMVLAPTQIGPIIAFMLFNILYMIVPITRWVVKAANKRETLVSID